VTGGLVGVEFGVLKAGALAECNQIPSTDAVTILVRVCTHAARFEPEADTLLKLCVEMIPQGIIEKNHRTAGDQ
jgi:hypothetical protein